jgi:hypothetical protein
MDAILKELEESDFSFLKVHKLNISCPLTEKKYNKDGRR